MNFLTSRKIFITVAALITWFAISLQFNVSLQALNSNYPATIKLLLSYFTVTTNIILALCFTTLWLFEDTALGKFFSKSNTLTAITVYISVVALVYNTILRGLVTPLGWARIADELLHVVDPLIFIAFWIFFVDKSKLEYKAAKFWMIYPLVYVVFVVIRGALIGQYPYPFINVIDLGYPKAIINATVVVIIFYLLSLFLIFIGKRSTEKH
ncbi:hypothetical protein DHW03_08880 [Pedobacter yonginense]|uniref:FAR-17a/AIG1-like protein n=1 Tax=Pedobacter yonginense TaxID=651869 RepID=A0A317EQU8_9SPHI|nr:Pr6Pr family membrane protein [Pedobacter yonginense]PWS27686.1 hypothetical protein DHW03_08880 [Pedobacter yonginense]